MSILLENPLGIGLFGLVVVGLLIFAAAQLGDRRVFYGAISALAVTVVLVFISIQVKTDREQIIDSITDLAADLRSNDHEHALSHMHPNAVPAIQRAQQDLASVHFQEAKVTSIRTVLVNESSHPPTATIEFIGYIKASSDRYTGGVSAGGLRLFKLYWMKHEGRWLIRDYEHSDARAALTN